MLIFVKVKPNGRKNEVLQQADGRWVVSVTASPVDGKANEAVIRLLAAHFCVAKRDIVIESGMNSRLKKIRIDGKASPDSSQDS